MTTASAATAARPSRFDPARSRPFRVVRAGCRGLRARPLRAVLAAIGIALGIAVTIAAVGISSSSRADLDALLDQIGTNLLTVTAGQAPGSPRHLPHESIPMIGQIDQVESVSGVGSVAGARAYRNDRVEKTEDDGVAVLAARTDLPTTVGATVEQGNWLDDATARLPVVVLGAAAANRLGLARDGVDTQIWLGGRTRNGHDPPKADGTMAAPEADVSGSLGEEWFTVVGILAPVPLAPELDNAALVGWPVAEDRLGFNGYPTTVYVRVAEHAVDDVRDVLARTADPQHPDQVQVGRPSDAIEAMYAADSVSTGMLLGLGLVALGAGGIGVAATMAVSVLERRSEIGLRRALGATRGQIRAQFLTEGILLSLLGGVAGVLLGAGIIAGYAAAQGWPAVVPVGAAVGGVAAAGVVGAVAAIHPAIRAGRLTPVQALAAPRR
jgi:putative ABC transport system permease protein